MSKCETLDWLFFSLCASSTTNTLKQSIVVSRVWKFKSTRVNNLSYDLLLKTIPNFNHHPLNSLTTHSTTFYSNNKHKHSNTNPLTSIYPSSFTLLLNPFETTFNKPNIQTKTYCIPLPQCTTPPTFHSSDARVA